MREPTLRVLNLGCGEMRLDFPEASSATEIVGVDISPVSQADVLHDLNIVPYPFESDRFDLVILQDVIEHVVSVPAVLSEVYRLLRNGGRVRIRTPHYSSFYAYNDPTHIHFFGALALDGFDADSPTTHYSSARFRFLKREILFPRIWRITGVAALANRYTEQWEQIFAFIFRAENLYFELEAVKYPLPGELEPALEQ